MTIDLGDRGWNRLDGEAIGAVEASRVRASSAHIASTPGRVDPRSAEDKFDEPSEAAMAAWEEVERHAFACTTIPLWPDVDLDDPAERRSPSTQWALRHNANVSWANQLGMARDEAEFHQVFSSLQSDPAVDTVAARHIAYALTGDPHLQHVSREAAIGAMESYFYQQREQAHQEQRQSQGGAAR